MATPPDKQTSATPRKTSSYLISQLSIPPSRGSQPLVDSPRQDHPSPFIEEDVDAKSASKDRPDILSTDPQGKDEDHITSVAHQTNDEEPNTPVRGAPSSSREKSTPSIAKPPLPVNRRLTFTSSPSQAKQLSVPPVSFRGSVASPSPLFKPLRSKSPTAACSEYLSAPSDVASIVKDTPVTGPKTDDESLASTSQAAPIFRAINSLLKSSPAGSSKLSSKKSKSTKVPTREDNEASKPSPVTKPPSRIRPHDLPWDDKETLRLWEAHWDVEGNEINRQNVGLIRANAHRKWRESNGYGNAHRNWTTLEERMEHVFESGISLDELRARVEEGERQGSFPTLPEAEVVREKTFAERAKESYRKSRTPAREDSIAAALLGRGGSRASASSGKNAMKHSVPDKETPFATIAPVNTHKASTSKTKTATKRRAPDADILDQAFTPALMTTPAKRTKKPRLASAPLDPSGEDHRASSPVTEQEEIEAWAYLNQARVILRKHCRDVMGVSTRSFDDEFGKWAGEYVERFRRERPVEYAEWERDKKAREGRAGRGKEVVV